MTYVIFLPNQLLFLKKGHSVSNHKLTLNHQGNELQSQKKTLFCFRPKNDICIKKKNQNKKPVFGILKFKEFSIHFCASLNSSSNPYFQQKKTNTKLKNDELLFKKKKIKIKKNHNNHCI